MHLLSLNQAVFPSLGELVIALKDGTLITNLNFIEDTAIQTGNTPKILVEAGTEGTGIKHTIMFVSTFKPTPDGGYEQRFVRPSV